MLFNSYIFLLVFLPLVLVAWWHPWAGLSTRLTMLTGASYLFYGWWDSRFILLLLVSTCVDYTAGHLLATARSPWRRRGALVTSLLVNLGLLGFFKYSGFFARSFNEICQAIHGGQPLPVLEIVLPIGISFYTFQTMSYTIDIYRGQARPAPSLLHFAAYVSMFPQLIAGPIVRYRELEGQLRHIHSTPDWELMARGVFFFVAGMGQKLLLADAIATRIDPMLADYATLKWVGSWYAMLGYATQLYFDFAGYSNMAVGLGLMLGFRFPQNFNSPYKAANISSFWRRWHITLSQWLRDYLFLPLGGSQYGRWLTLRNLVIVMFLGGLWHGAGWTFVLWGLFHGVLLVTHRLFHQQFPRAVPPRLGTLFTFLMVVFSWVLFRSTDLAMAGHLTISMLGGNGVEAGIVAACGGYRAVGLLVSLLAGVFCLPNLWEVRFRPSRAWMIVLSSLLVLCILRLDAQSPFLYFQF